ncbi:MAG: antibiotic biosynthesis monooxygenase [Chitinophagaceae bacterium]|nr:antibiotic biosynthesis monooxygenase [Chitinophagaceae bacterium]
MITRIWHGITKTEDADSYLKYIEDTGIKDYKNIKGNLSAKILRRVENDICHFQTITEWDSWESIIQFAGKDFEKASYYEEDKKYLLEFDDKWEKLNNIREMSIDKWQKSIDK